jgi:exonuclease III
MRVVVWNCRQGLGRKMAVLDQLDADIVVIPECGSNALPDGRSVWVGRNPHKGLGVISRSNKPSIVGNGYDESLRWFLPIQFENSRVKLFAAWAFNHRDGLNRYSTLSEAVRRYEGFLAGRETIIAGDMNDNVIWDKAGREGFRETVEQLRDLGYTSAYHSFFDEAFGRETRPTYRHSTGLGYHIDYCFLPAHWLNGARAAVVPPISSGALSDHTPLVVDFDSPE